MDVTERNDDPVERLEEQNRDKQSRWEKLKSISKTVWSTASSVLGLGGNSDTSGSYSDLQESSAAWNDKKGLEEEYTRLVQQKKDLQGEVDGITKDAKGISFWKLFGEYQQIQEVRNLTKLNQLKGQEASLLRERDSALVSLMGGYDLSPEEKESKIQEVQKMVDELSDVREQVASRTAAMQKDTVMSKIFQLKEARKLVNKVIAKVSGKDEDTKAVAMNSIEGGMGPTVIVKKLDTIQIKVDILRNELLRRLNSLEETIGSKSSDSPESKEKEETLLDKALDYVQDYVEDYVEDSLTGRRGKKGRRGRGRNRNRRSWRNRGGSRPHTSTRPRGRGFWSKTKGIFKGVGKWGGKALAGLGAGIGFASRASMISSLTSDSDSSLVRGAGYVAQGANAAATFAPKSVKAKGAAWLTKTIAGKLFKKISIKLATKAAAVTARYGLAASIPVAGWVAGIGMALWDLYDLADYFIMAPNERKRVRDSIVSVDPEVWRSLIQANLTEDFIKDKNWTQDEVQTLLQLPEIIKQSNDKESQEAVDSIIQYLEPDNLGQLTAPYNVQDKTPLKDQLALDPKGEGEFKKKGFWGGLLDKTLNVLTTGVYGAVAEGFRQTGIQSRLGSMTPTQHSSNISEGSKAVIDRIGKSNGVGGYNSGAKTDGKSYEDLMKNTYGYSDEQLKTGKESIADIIANYEKETGKKVNFKLKDHSDPYGQGSHSKGQSQVDLKGLDPRVIDEVEKLASELGIDSSQFVVTAGAEPYPWTKHSKKSMHYIGKAVDIRTKDPNLKNKDGIPIQKLLYDIVAAKKIRKRSMGYWVKSDSHVGVLFESPGETNEHIHLEVRDKPGDGGDQAIANVNSSQGEGKLEPKEGQGVGAPPKVSPGPRVNKPKEDKSTKDKDIIKSTLPESPFKSSSPTINNVRNITNVNNNTNYNPTVSRNTQKSEATK